MDKILNNFWGKSEHGQWFTYEKYQEDWQNYLNNSDLDLMTEQQRYFFEYSKLNWQRSQRIEKSYQINNEISELIKNIDFPIYFNIVTENWCGDSAQNLPYFMKYLNMNPKFNVRIILRDENLEVVDNYFKNTNPRSIPKLVAFDTNGNELFVWGPRPKIAQDLVSQLIAEGYTNKEFNESLHLWYGRNKGKELEKEIVALFENILTKK